jgi:hypothetical protein
MTTGGAVEYFYKVLYGVVVKIRANKINRVRTTSKRLDRIFRLCRSSRYIQPFRFYIILLVIQIR